MKSTPLYTLMIVALTVTNSIFLFLIYKTLEVHQNMINKHGVVLEALLNTPEISVVLNQEIARRIEQQQSTEHDSTNPQASR